ncbi:phage portal protein [Peribacillus frigoritolerans]|uniref:phage portal protein n=1 Tax=Peribacillus frigoritolerans TaxID=450367 RepID=UPI002E1BE3BE|nr:phage portal protein [Peribacillus frigoritolerans]MED3710027.1 phage portal protein [Peribacillus frigoritolerans]
MGILDLIKSRNKELEFMFDFDLIQDKSKKVHMKQLAIQTCINMIGQTISQSEFYVKKDKKIVKDDMYYCLNVRPNPNMSASHFWQTVIHKLIYDNECLIIQSDTEDLIIADSFTRIEYALVDDSFKDVTIKDFTYSRTFQMSDVIYLEYSNKKLSTMLDGLYADYGELFGRIIEFQNRKNQIRGLVDVEAITDKSEKGQEKLQNYINKIYKAFSGKSVAIVPQQKGFKLEEMKNTTQLQSVDEVAKVIDGFLDQVAKALGIPIALLHGDMADVEKPTRNYMTFCIDPFLKKIKDELNAKLIDKKDYLAGKKMETKRVSNINMFDVATAVDKLRASGTFNGNELRDALGEERVDDPIMDRYFITKNYQESSEVLKGGEEDET